jgi:hypothetical protein
LQFAKLQNGTQGNPGIPFYVIACAVHFAKEIKNGKK